MATKANQPTTTQTPPAPSVDRKPAIGSAGYRVRTPHASFQGSRCGVAFKNGVGQTDDEDVAKSCYALGYTIECIATGKRLGFRPAGTAHPPAK